MGASPAKVSERSEVHTQEVIVARVSGVAHFLELEAQVLTEPRPRGDTARQFGLCSKGGVREETSALTQDLQWS